jgi:hypothetical protein
MLVLSLYCSRNIWNILFYNTYSFRAILYLSSIYTYYLVFLYYTSIYKYLLINDLSIYFFSQLLASSKIRYSVLSIFISLLLNSYPKL